MSSSAAAHLIMGAFDSERYWRDSNLAKLPGFHDPETANIVLAMDELLFTLCSERDILFTRFTMNEAHKQYLNEIGFIFGSNSNDIEAPQYRTAALDSSVFELMPNMEFESNEWQELTPFAVIPEVDRVAAQLGLQLNAPSLDTVKQVNAKLYSVELNRQLLGYSHSTSVFSHEELLTEGTKLLNHSPFLVKDDYGVSGKGNLLIDSAAIMERVASYIGAQERKGKKVRFIVEPLLDKRLDFSCQFHIDRDGNYTLLAVQKLINHHFAYLGSFTADSFLMDRLQQAGYFDQMKQVAQQLYLSGYYGDVCVDSMLLRNGEVIPIVEVNARKSMSLIKHSMDIRLTAHSMRSSMTYVTVQFTNQHTFQHILDAFREDGLLYTREQGYGILPLSANALFINQMIQRQSDLPHKRVKGRLYMYVIPQYNETETLITKAKEKLMTLSFNIIN